MMDQNEAIAFPILNLPEIALRKCLENMDILQLINFGCCTEDTALLAKSMSYEKKNVKITVNCEEIQIVLFGDDSRILQRITKSVEPATRISQAQFISELFHSDISQIQFSIERFDEEFQWLQNRQKTIYDVMITGEAKTGMAAERVYSTIFNGTLQITCMLKINVDQSPDSRISPEIFNNVFKTCQGSLEVWKSQWFRPEHLVNTKVSKLVLRNSGITNEEVNHLLKQWKVGGVLLENLKILAVRGNQPNEDVYLEGINATWNPTNRLFNSDRWIREGWDFRRDTDGKLATVVGSTTQ